MFTVNAVSLTDKYVQYDIGHYSTSKYHECRRLTEMKRIRLKTKLLIFELMHS
jgi:hypothetical protein